MKTRLLIIWDRLHTSYWFVPSVMTILSILFSVVTLDLEQRIDEDWVYKFPFIWSGGPEGARQVLATIAGSMITVAGVVFSITIVALTLASSQFGPRLLRNFMADTGNQIVLGTFISTFIYCLLILRSVQGTDEHMFVPYLSVTVGLVLAVCSLGVLIFFIHHVSDSIQAENLIATVGHELLEAIDEIYPNKADGTIISHQIVPELPDNLEDNSKSIKSDFNGYLQTVNLEALTELATTYNLLIRMVHRPGAFLNQGSELVKVYPGKMCTDEIVEKIKKTFITGNHRTPTQDVAYPIHQLVEVALRALSPSINDPFTALSCIDWLGTGLCKLIICNIPTPYQYGSDHKLRLITDPFTFEILTDATFSPIRDAGKNKMMILIRLLDTVKRISFRVTKHKDKETLLHHASQIYTDGMEGVSNPADRDKLKAKYYETINTVNEVNTEE